MMQHPLRTFSLSYDDLPLLLLLRQRRRAASQAPLLSISKAFTCRKASSLSQERFCIRAMYAYTVCAARRPIISCTEASVSTTSFPTPLLPGAAWKTMSNVDMNSGYLQKYSLGANIEALYSGVISRTNPRELRDFKAEYRMCVCVYVDVSWHQDTIRYYTLLAQDTENCEPTYHSLITRIPQCIYTILFWFLTKLKDLPSIKRRNTAYYFFIFLETED